MLDLLGTYLVLALASGRVAFSLTKDEIFRPLREWIWMRSAPEEAMIVTRGDNGDQTIPARMMHLHHDRGRTSIGEHYVTREFKPQDPMRAPGFFGQLFECFYCMSFWTSLLAYVVYRIDFSLAWHVATPLAIWAVANAYAHRIAN